MLNSMLADKTRPLVMGIVNVTPDSFSDGGRYFDKDKAINHAMTLVEEGADILDIGGESTRPGADAVSLDEELSRVMPVIEGLRAQTDIPVSIDTRHAEVMRQAIRAGATMVNDVSALEDDVQSLSVVRDEFDGMICLMHKRGEPKTMQLHTDYDDVVTDVYRYLEKRVQVCVGAGISRSRLIVDPGIGFGKTLEQNLLLLRHLGRFSEMGLPVLLGASRKTFISDVMGGNILPQDRLGGSLAAAIIGSAHGADIIRVHDVAQTKQALTVFHAVHRG